MQNVAFTVQLGTRFYLCGRLLGSCSGGPKDTTAKLTPPSDEARRVVVVNVCAHCRATSTKAPESVVDKLMIRAMTVTNEDMSAIAAVLATGFPLTAMSATQSHGRVYGSVDVDEGTQLWSRESPSDDSNALVASCNFRCRASCDVTNSDFVDLVVPGYGACKTRLGDSTQFTPDVTKLRPNEKRLCDELVLVFKILG